MKTKIIKALQKQGHKVIYVKGVFILKNGQRLTRIQAMKLTGIKAKPRQAKIQQQLFGDYAWIAAINYVK